MSTFGTFAIIAAIAGVIAIAVILVILLITVIKSLGNGRSGSKLPYKIWKEIRQGGGDET